LTYLDFYYQKWYNGVVQPAREEDGGVALMKQWKFCGDEYVRTCPPAKSTTLAGIAAGFTSVGNIGAPGVDSIERKDEGK
jgi:hypothetical protein